MSRRGLTRHGSGRAVVTGEIAEVICRRCVLPLDPKFSVEAHLTGHWWDEIAK